MNPLLYTSLVTLLCFYVSVFAQDEYELYMAALLDSQPTAQYQVITIRKDTKRFVSQETLNPESPICFSVRQSGWCFFF
jgi:hypothetical protein